MSGRDEKLGFGRRVSRREALSTAAKIGLAAGIGVVVGAIGGYLGGSAYAPAKTITETKTITRTQERTVERTIEKTVTLTGTVTMPAPTTVTTVPATTTITTPRRKVSGEIKLPLHKPPWLPGLQAMIENYEKANPGTKINLDLVASFTDLRDKEIMDAREGTGLWDIYTLTYMMACQTVYYRWAYRVKDLDPAYKMDPNLLYQEWLFDPDGELRGLPLNLNNDLLYYRRDLFEERGLKIPPKTWDDVLEAAKTLHDPSKPLYGFIPRCADDPGLEAYVLLRSYGGDYFVDWKNGDFSVRINDAHGLAAFEMFAELLKYAPPSPASLTQSNMIEHMAAGTGAQALIVYAGTPWMDDPSYSKVVGKVDFAVPPAGTGLPGCRHASVECGWALGASLKTRNPDLAIDFMEFCTQYDQQLIFAKIGVGPVNYKVATDPSLINDPKYRNLKAQSEAMKYTVYQPNFPEITYIVNPIMKDFVQMIATGTPVKEALNKVAETIYNYLRGKGYRTSWTKNLWEKG